MNFIENASKELGEFLLELPNLADTAIRNLASAINNSVQITYDTLVPYYQSLTGFAGSVAANVANGLYNAFIVSRQAAQTAYNTLVPYYESLVRFVGSVTANIVSGLYNVAIVIKQVTTTVYSRFIPPIAMAFKNGYFFIKKVGIYTANLILVNVLIPLRALVIKATNYSFVIIVKAVNFFNAQILTPAITVISYLANYIAKFGSKAWKLLSANVLQPVLTALSKSLNYVATLLLNITQAIYSSVLKPLLIAIGKNLNYFALKLFNLARFVFVKILLPLMSAIKNKIEYAFKLFVKVVSLLQRYIGAPLLNFAHSLINIIVKLPSFAIKCIEILGNVVLGIVGTPIFAYNKLTGKKMVYAAASNAKNIRYINLTVGTLALLAVGYVLAKRYINRNENQESQNTLANNVASVQVNEVRSSYGFGAPAMIYNYLMGELVSNSNNNLQPINNNVLLDDNNILNGRNVMRPTLV